MGRQSALKYKRFLQQAEELFTRLGYKAVFIDEIAQGSGVSKATIYKYFNSKEELFLHTITNITKNRYDRLEQALEHIEEAVEKLEFLFDFSLKAHKKYSASFLVDMIQIPPIWDKIIGYRKKDRLLYAKGY